MSEQAPKPFAAFDVDGTIFKSSLAEKVIESCIHAGLFKPEAFEKSEDYRKRWQNSNNEGVYQAYLHHLIGGFIDQIAGKPVKEFNEITNEMLREQRVRRYAFPRKLIDRLQASHHIVVISGSPDVIVRPFLEDLDVHTVYGTELHIKKDHFTGAVAPIRDKATVIDRLLEHGVVTSAGSMAIGDTIADFPMLDMADTPILFNCSRTLKNAGEGFGWTRVHEIKDNITVLQMAEGTHQYIETSEETLFYQLQHPHD